MRRLTLLACLALIVGLATPLLTAAPPDHERRTTYTGTLDAAAGDLCDFTYHQEYVIDEWGTFFPDGGYVVHQDVFVTHTNVDTGLTLSERDHTNYQFSPSKERFRQTGLWWHLRTPDGKLTLVQAGQILYDTAKSPWEIVKVTPNINTDFAAVVCPALGGNPAP